MGSGLRPRLTPAAAAEAAAEAARDAAGDAARAAASAASDAARDAAWAAEREWQVERLSALLDDRRTVAEATQNGAKGNEP